MTSCCAIRRDPFVTCCSRRREEMPDDTKFRPPHRGHYCSAATYSPAYFLRDWYCGIAAAAAPLFFMGRCGAKSKRSQPPSVSVNTRPSPPTLSCFCSFAFFSFRSFVRSFLHLQKSFKLVNARLRNQVKAGSFGAGGLVPGLVLDAEKQLSRWKVSEEQPITTTLCTAAWWLITPPPPPSRTRKLQPMQVYVYTGCGCCGVWDGQGRVSA